MVKNGIPFDVADALTDAERLAYIVAFGEMDGSTWNWNSMSWNKRG